MILPTHFNTALSLNQWHSALHHQSLWVINKCKLHKGLQSPDPITTLTLIKRHLMAADVFFCCLSCVFRSGWCLICYWSLIVKSLQSYFDNFFTAHIKVATLAFWDLKVWSSFNFVFVWNSMKTWIKYTQGLGGYLWDEEERNLPSIIFSACL